MSWPTYGLDELGVVSRGRSRHRPRDAQHLYGGPFPFVQTGDVKAAPLFLTNYLQTYSDAGLAQSKLWPTGTLCITIAANIAETCILGIDACFPDSIIGFVADPAKANTRFIKYQFDAVMRDQMRRVSHGVAQDNLSQEKLLSFRFPVPDVPTQERIASILSAYDDLIENNRRRIGLLEQAARLLYREWFVHFRFPGHETAKFVDGLPGGWERKPIGEIWSISYGKNLPTSKISETGKFPVHGADSIIGYYDQRNVDERLCLITCRGNGSGNVRRTFGPTFVTNNCFVLRPNHRAEELHFHFATNAMTVLKLQDMRTGAAQPQLTLAGIAHVRLSLPPSNLLARYNEIVDRQIDLADALRRQNAQLTRARDLLLPRLMDGRIPV